MYAPLANEPQSAHRTLVTRLEHRTHRKEVVKPPSNTKAPEQFGQTRVSGVPMTFTHWGHNTSQGPTAAWAAFVVTGLWRVAGDG